MGIVWLAHDQVLGEDVALKFLPDLVRWDQAALQELKAETRRARALTHPNIIRIHDLIEDGSGAAISMEFVEGRTLTEVRLAQPQGVLGPAEIQPWLGQLCAALDYAHSEARIVHRDLKPSNLLLTPDGRIKVTDFGVARSLVDSMSRVSAWAPSGTLLYMSPQQAMGEPPAPADDIYALGALLYELLTSKPPFHTGNIQSQISLRKPDTLAHRRRLLGITGANPPAHWEAGISACLAKRPEDRPARAAAVAAQLITPPTRSSGMLLRRGRTARPLLFGVLALTLGLFAWFYRPWATRPATATVVAFPSDTTRALAAWNLDGTGQEASGRELHLIGPRTVPTRDRHGRIDRALHFNGNAQLQHDNFPTAGWTGTQPFTIALWVRPQGSAGMNGSLVGLRPDQQGECYWELTLSEGRPMFYVGKLQQEDPDEAAGTVRLQEGQWAHVAAINDGRQLLLFVNGQPAGIHATNASHNTAKPGRAALNVGFVHRLDARKFAGDLDQLRLWRRALTAGEITALAAPGPEPDFVLTHGIYSEREDLAAVARREFGADTTLAEWNDLRQWHADDTRAWADELGLRVGQADVYVQRAGRRNPEGPRHYFVTRFDGRKPDYYRAHDELGGMTLALGSWYGSQMRALVARPFTPPVREQIRASADGLVIRSFAPGEVTRAIAISWMKEFVRNSADQAVQVELRLRDGRKLRADFNPSTADNFSLSLGEATNPQLTRQMGASYDLLEFTLVAQAGRLRFRAVSVRGAEPLFIESISLPQLEVAELRLSGVDAAELIVEK
jgi:hypothetical protein